MNDAAIRQLAQQAGIAVDWIDAESRPRQVAVPSLVRLLEALGLPCAGADDLRESSERLKRMTASPPLVTATTGAPTRIAPDDEKVPAELVLEDGWRKALILRDGIAPPIATPGYHKLRYGEREITLAVAPPRCVTLADIGENRRLWGIGVQLYSLRRAGDFGIGDTTGLRALGAAAGSSGADAIAVSPTHSLFPFDPSRYGPYSPSNRLFLNPLLADPADALGAERVAMAAGSAKIADRPLIDWKEAAHAKFGLLRRLYDDFALRDLASTTALAAEFRTFVREAGAALHRHAQFEAQAAPGPAPLDYFLFLQWIADASFARAQSDLRAGGMCLGIVSDLAIGLDPEGSQVGADPAQFLAGLSIGAPPDAFNPKGQDWGLTSFSPQALVAGGFEPFIATLRAALRHAGGVRIDHAMGLMRLWLVPNGALPIDGAYLSYPMDDLMRLLALESHRHHAPVIGEDLGTVPAGFRARCRALGMAGMDVLWFARDGAGFLEPARWRDDAIATTSTHDLPTVAGWWQGADLELRRGLGTVKQGDVEEREHDRAALWQAFTDAGVATGTRPPADGSAAAVDAAVAFVAMTPSPLALVPLEDMIGTAEQPNLPGTINEHPNWRRRFSQPADKLLQEPAAVRRLGLLRQARP
ncbi:4-alpha-glucanotransferase [Reyranella sp.]|uniref:4-alpha-glucanotransferase n=1 Tax=Reyranella sp. TaxID=1929291 RepID=UPI002F958AEB